MLANSTGASLLAGPPRPVVRQALAGGQLSDAGLGLDRRLGSPGIGDDEHSGAVVADDLLDVLALEHLVREQALGEGVEQRAILGDQLLGPAPGHVGELLLLLVDRPSARL